MLKVICSCCAAEMEVEGSAFYLPCLDGISESEKHQLCLSCHQTLMAEYQNLMIPAYWYLPRPALYISPPSKNGFVDIRFLDPSAARATLKLFRLDHRH